MSCPSHTDGIYLCWKLVIVYLKFKLDWRHSIFITPSGNPTQITLRAFRPACHCHTTPSLRLHSTSPLTLATLAFKNHLKCPFLCKIFPIFLRQFRSSCNMFTSVYERLATVNWLLVFPADHELSKGTAGSGYLYLHAWYVGDTSKIFLIEWINEFFGKWTIAVLWTALLLLFPHTAVIYLLKTIFFRPQAISELEEKSIGCTKASMK